MTVSRSARVFLERKGIYPTRRNPLPRYMPAQSRVHSVPIEKLRSDIAQTVEGFPPSDRGATQDWPPQPE